MFGEPMDLIVAVVGGIWVLCSVTAVTILLWVDIFKGRPPAFFKAMDTVGVWTNRIMVVVALFLIAVYSFGVAYHRWDVWVLVVPGVLLGLLLVAGGFWLFAGWVALGTKLRHKQERGTDSADHLDADPGVGELAGVEQPDD